RRLPLRRSGAPVPVLPRRSGVDAVRCRADTYAQGPGFDLTPARLRSAFRAGHTFPARSPLPFLYHAQSGGLAWFPLLRFPLLRVRRRSLLPLPVLHPGGYTRPVRFRWSSFCGGWGSSNRIVMGFVTRLGVALPSVSLTARGGLTNLDTLFCASLAY